MGDDRLNLAEIISESTSVDRFKDRLFCLGPNVGRINFLSQQIRALNLVWALQKREIIGTNSMVGVVGAGISGVTVAVALRAFNCTVRLFDRGARPMYRQRDATHRHIFPNINWWPHGDKDLAVTTALPFLDWHLGQCNLVISALDAEWRKLKRESGTELEFIENVTILSARSDRSREDRLWLTSDKGIHKEPFDAVIVASGFGDEHDHLGIGTKSYWEPDKLESVRDGEHPKMPAIVSGFGDGGQIDALRLAFEFEFGELSFKIAQALVGTPLSKQIEAIEQGSAPARYEELVDELWNNPGEYSHVVAMLDEKLHERVGLVIMIDRFLETPYQSGAAPIHKLLVAYAFKKATLDYKRGVLAKAADYGDTAYQIDGGGEVFDSTKNHIVIRHGAETSFNHTLIYPEEWETLKERQESAKAYSYKYAWDDNTEPFAVPSGWPCRHKEESRYIEERKKLAQDAIRNMGSSGMVVPAADRFIVYNHSCDFQPKSLFGKPVDYKLIDDRLLKPAAPMA